MRKVILPLFLALVFGAVLSACKDSGGVPTVNQPLECVEGMDCYVAPQSQFVFEKLPTPECVVDADCDSDKLCNNGKCEEMGSDENSGDSSGDNGVGSGNGGSGGTGGGATVVNVKTPLTLSSNIVLLAGSGNFCPAGCQAGQECKANKCVDIPPPAGEAGQGGGAMKQCMAECKPGSICMNGICTRFVNLPKKKIVVIEGAGSSGFRPDAVAEGRGSSGESMEDEKECSNDEDCQIGKVCKIGMCIDDINVEVATNECTINGATGVIDKDGKCSINDPCKLDFKVVPTNAVLSGDDKTYNYNDSVNVGFWAKGAKGDKIKWTVSRNTEVFYTKSGKQYIEKWNEDVPISCLNGEYCSFEVKFRLGNSKEYKAKPYKTRLSIIDYFKDKITVKATREQSQCVKKSVATYMSLNFKFNKPKLEDETIKDAILAFKTYVEWVNDLTGLTVLVEDINHGALGDVYNDLAAYEESHLEVLAPLATYKNSKSPLIHSWAWPDNYTFKDVKFFEWQAYDDDPLAPFGDLYFNLNYLMLAGKDIYAIVGSGWNIMDVDDHFESWHWTEGVDFTWFMRCHPDDDDSGEPNMAEMLACGEEQGGGNM